jgi:hypothetical protein
MDLLRLCLLVAAASVSPPTPDTEVPAGEPVAPTSRPAASPRHHVPVTVAAGGFDRYDRPAEVEINFTQLLKAAGDSRPFDEASIRVAETDGAGKGLDAAVAFQFDRAVDYDAAKHAAGTLVIMMKGKTPKGAARRFRVAFAGGSGAPRADVKPLVKLADDVAWQGQKSFRIATPGATYVYHEQGAGFASLIDIDKADWISYRPRGGASGNYRGIPNLVHPEGHFHPGGKGCGSRLVSAGPLKVTIASESKDKKWACRWEVFPGFARLTVLKAAHAYWFLYEGTPGGGISKTDYCVRSPGKRTDIRQRWSEKLPAPQWLYFGDAKLKRALWFVKHEADRDVDSYYQMGGERGMTVFGFGRKGLGKYMKQLPAHFTIGLAEDKGEKRSPSVVDVINSAFRELKVTVGRVVAAKD